ncbi:MAG: hypothetical protein PHS44_03240 [Candidatus Dojkabacteria bacterium]|jgi:hypothetical protein|nr:hypothetical protein [Candidatus Dojkabacteria bacterium]
MSEEDAKVQVEKLPGKYKSLSKSNKTGKVLSSTEKIAVGSSAFIGSIGLGAAGAVLGAFLWYIVASVTNIQIGYFAILIGIFVGFGMKILLKGTNSLMLGLIAGVLSLFGLVLGNFLLWSLQMPKWTRESLVEDYGYTQEEALEFSDSQIREIYPFGDYLKDDLTSSEGGNNPVISWVFYLLAVYIGFSRVFDLRNPNKSI